jgi:3-methyladenine DNA glycosylase AlkD
MLDVFAELIQSKSWWDTVDSIAPLVGQLLNRVSI